jgi:hypothetical protein
MSSFTSYSFRIRSWKDFSGFVTSFRSDRLRICIHNIGVWARLLFWRLTISPIDSLPGVLYTCFFWCYAVVYMYNVPAPVLSLVQVIGGDGLAREAHRAILSRLRQQNTHKTRHNRYGFPYEMKKLRKFLQGESNEK